MSPNSHSLRRAGFTLIELIVVMVILVTLAGIIVPRVANRSKDAWDARRVSDLTAVESALNMYFMDNGAYPTTNNAWIGEAPNYGGLGYDENGYIPGLVPDYLPMLPSDPNPEYPTTNKGYLYRSDGKDFKFLAHNTPNEFPTDHRFFDARRPTRSWQVSSSGGRAW